MASMSEVAAAWAKIQKSATFHRPDLDAEIALVDKALDAARRYTALWKIVHESDPRPPEGDERVLLGYVRGELFAASGAVR
jgi:hypothetical protein